MILTSLKQQSCYQNGQNQKHDMRKVKASKEDKKAFNDLNKLIIDINNNKVKKEDAVERLNKSISDLDQLKQKQSTAFQYKMIQVVYQLNQIKYHYGSE